MSSGLSLVQRSRRFGVAGPGVAQAICAWGALLATFASVVGLFTISALALESFGIGYLTSGGGILAKVHPASLLAFAALVLRCLATPRPDRTLLRLSTRDNGCVLLAAAVAVMALVASIVDKMPVSPLVDTFVLPIVLLILLRDLDGDMLRRLAIAVALVMSVNAVLALTEAVRGMHFIALDVPDGASADPSRGDAVFDWRADLATDWRAEALLGHPLDNGLLTGVFILCLVAPAARWIPMAVRVPLVILQAVAMFAFGARTALVLTTLFAGWSLFRQMARSSAHRWRGIVVTLALLAVGLLVVVETGILERTIARFSEDSGSAGTRLTMFRLFDTLSLQDLLLGPDKDVVATLQRLHGLEFGIESSWVGLALSYGVIVTAIAIAGLAAFFRSLLRVGGGGTGFVLALFILLVSIAASLSGKITSFAMTTALIVVFLRRDASGQAPRVELVVRP